MPNLDPSFFYNMGVASLIGGLVFLMIGYLMSKDL